jgi:hypothetical protein
MKWHALTRTDRRALSLGALVALPVLAYTLAVRPYLTALADTRARVSDERALLARERQLVGQAPSFPVRHRLASAALGTTWTRLVRGADTLSVAAVLANQVTDAASGAGLLVEQVETHGADSIRTAALSRVRLGVATVELRARGDLKRILDFLDALETGETLVRIDRLRIERSPAGTDAADQETLAIAVTVTGIAHVLAHPASLAPRSTLAHRSAPTISGSNSGDPADAGRAP